MRYVFAVIAFLIILAAMTFFERRRRADQDLDDFRKQKRDEFHDIHRFHD
jgi:hypothetical protein